MSVRDGWTIMSVCLRRVRDRNGGKPMRKLLGLLGILAVIGAIAALMRRDHDDDEFLDEELE